MEIEVYCDESRPDLFTTAEKYARFLSIGSLWLPAEQRESVKAQVKHLRDKHSVHGSAKWHKVSPSRLGFYLELADLFVAFGPDVKFRSIFVPVERVDFERYHQDDRELGFYKFYYQMLHQWILPPNRYSIFCDVKTNRRHDRLAVLQRCLSRATPSAQIAQVQAIPERESSLIQIADFLLGAASSRMNATVKVDGAKWQVIRHLENCLRTERLASTARSAGKFNLFRMDLEGGQHRG